MDEERQAKWLLGGLITGVIVLLLFLGSEVQTKNNQIDSLKSDVKVLTLSREGSLYERVGTLGYDQGITYEEHLYLQRLVDAYPACLKTLVVANRYLEEYPARGLSATYNDLLRGARRYLPLRDKCKR